MHHFEWFVQVLLAKLRILPRRIFFLSADTNNREPGVRSSLMDCALKRAARITDVAGDRPQRTAVPLLFIFLFGTSRARILQFQLGQANGVIVTGERTEYDCTIGSRLR